ncbi:MAG TPA: hypothetical protein VFR58_02745 [Flavisolibacter sp.]|nr:hypothetical protein [Flavisolibacter sp.]
MSNFTPGRKPAISPAEKTSVKILMEKMGMSKKEIHEVNNKYGVSAAQLVELMKLSKYQFVYTNKADGQCEPSEPYIGRPRAMAS